MNFVRWLPLALAAAGMFAQSSLARIKLITLPVRERVEIQLDHPQATLVEEERIVPLVKGENQVDFSWANTAIDPSTIVFRVVDKPEAVKVLSVSYPPGEAAWRIVTSTVFSGLRSGCHLSAHLRYADLISSTDAVRVTPSTS